MISIITTINNALNRIVWGPFGIALLLSAGVLLTVVNRGFQFVHIGLWLKNTIGAVFVDRHITAHTGKENKSISQFQSISTALSATVGTGNIVGVAAAIIFGGPGSIFWMWVMAFLGMMTHYSETILGIFYRQKTQIIYKLVFTPVVYIGCTMSLSLAWNLSDTFNGLMMIPNIIGVISLSPLVGRITKNYLDRELHGKELEPLLSATKENAPD